MKKLLVLLMVLAVSAISTAATVELEIVGGPAPVGDFGGIPSYEGSTWINIGLVASGFGTGLPDGIYRMKTDIDGTGGTAASPVLNTGFDDLSTPGTAGPAPDLITGADGGVLMSSPGIGAGTLLEFEFHVPELPYSTVIEIVTDGLVLKNGFDIALAYTVVEPLLIHVTPEPMTIALLGLGGLFLRRRK